jgi:carboxylesterase
MPTAFSGSLAALWWPLLRASGMMTQGGYRRRPSKENPTVPNLPGALAFASPGTGENARIGVLLSHGFTGTPQSMRDWADHLAAEGYAVRLPLLPGHGTRWQDMNKTGWLDWYGEIRAAYSELAEQCDVVFAAGLSMGGTLVTKLAEDLADSPADTPASKLAGLVLVNAAFGTQRRDAFLARYVSWLITSRPGIGSDVKRARVAEEGYERTPLRAFVSLQQLWKVVVADLAKITVPILYFHSVEDHVVDELSGQLLHAGASSTTVTEVPLTNSYHVATVDNDAQTIFAGSVEFIKQKLATTASPVGD